MSTRTSWLADHALLARVYAVLVLSRLVALLPPRRLAAVVERLAALSRRRGRSAGDLVAAVDHVLLSGKPFVRNTCVTRGLTRFFFLRRAGDDVSLVFGIGRVDANMEGHCWLERGGTPVYENRDPYEGFATIWSIPTS